MFSHTTLHAKKSQLLTLVSTCLVGAAIFSGCAAPMGSKSNSSTAAKPATTTTNSTAVKSTTTTNSTAAKPATAANNSTAGKSTTTTNSTVSKTTTTQPAMMETVMLHKDAKLGSFLTDGNGMTLYIYAKDSAGKSACTGDCTKNWMPYVVADANAKLTEEQSVTGKLSLIKRDDGKFQVAYDGMPLYYYSQDKQSGDVHGQGMGNNWWVFGADGKQITTKLS